MFNRLFCKHFWIRVNKGNWYDLYMRCKKCGKVKYFGRWKDPRGYPYGPSRYTLHLYCSDEYTGSYDEHGMPIPKKYYGFKNPPSSR